jgi:hypothetical protein
VEEDGSGMLGRVLLMRLRVKFGHFESEVSRLGWAGEMRSK